MNCRRELYTALAHNKLIIPVWESDENKGGASLDALREEVRQHCNEMVEAYPSFGGVEEVLQRVIDDETNAPIVWVRVHDFQVESLKTMAHLLLGVLPLTSRLRDRRLFVPGQLGRFEIWAPSTLLVCNRNGEAARSVAEEIRAASKPAGGAAVLQIRSADEVLSGSLEAIATKSINLLIYLNKDTFCDGDIATEGSVAHLVTAFMDRVHRSHLLTHENVSHALARVAERVRSRVP